MYKAAGMLLEGRVEGVPLFLDGLDAYRATGHGCALPYYLSILGSVHTRMGRFKEALDTLDEGAEDRRGQRRPVPGGRAPPP